MCELAALSWPSIIPVAVAIAVACLTYVLVRLAEAQREPGGGGPADPLGPFRPVVRLVALANERAPARILERTRQRLQFAGVARWLDAAEFLAIQELGVLGCVLLVAAMNLGYPVLVVLAAPLGVLVPEAWLRSKMEGRRRGLLRQFPTFLDFLLVALQCGRGLQEAITLASRELGRGPVAEEFATVLAEMSTARSRADALRRLADRLRMPAITAFVAVVLQCDRIGADMREPLRAQADALRTQRLRQAETLAEQAPIKMLAPLVLLILPCMLVVTLAPIAVELAQSLAQWR